MWVKSAKKVDIHTDVRRKLLLHSKVMRQAPENATMKLRCEKPRRWRVLRTARAVGGSRPSRHSLLGATTGADATANVSPQLPVSRLGDSIVDPTSPLHPSSAVFPRVSRDHC